MFPVLRGTTFIWYLRNRKDVPCFYWVIQTRVEVWENEKCCGNTSRRQMFPQLFRVLPNFHECLYNSIETRSTCFLFLLENTYPGDRGFFLVGGDRIDLFSFVCLLSQCRSRDGALENYFFQIQTNPRENEWIILRYIKEKFPWEHHMIHNGQFTYVAKEVYWVAKPRLRVAKRREKTSGTNG